MPAVTSFRALSNWPVSNALIACCRDMADVTEDNAGEGRPADEFKVEKTELRKK